MLFLAVLPKYRSECIRLVREELGPSLGIFVSPAHLDTSVRTGVPDEFYNEIKIYRLFRGRAFLQWGGMRAAIAAETTVVDLNPRSISAWLILLLRRSMGRRTLVWGHIHPQAGAASTTAGVRANMRRLASGTISYTYRDAEKARADLSDQKVWTAPNSLYLRNQIFPAENQSDSRSDVLYVGRFALAKKVDLLVRGFALAAQSEPRLKLTLVGGGRQEAELRQLVSAFGLQDRVEFPGWIDDLALLRPYYKAAFCTASPGFAGLGLTQSLGFGVPMVVANAEPHSPEIELEDCGGVSYFDSDSAEDLATAILSRWNERGRLPDSDVSLFVKVNYSAESMADGLLAALENRNPKAADIRGDESLEKQ